MARWLALALSTGAACAAGPDADVGVGAQEIIGGSTTTGYPAVPLLLAELGDGTTSYCTGTLISPRVVLTAAHCLELDEAPVRHVAYFGADYTAAEDPARIDEIDVAGVEFDPDWNLDAPESGHDIGMVLLSRAAPVEPMLYNRSALDGHEGEDLHLVGWGRTSGDSEDYGIKRETMSELQTFDDRLLRYGSATANTCQGDSGGPNFLVDDDGAEVVVGVTSFGNVGCDQYGFGTNVSAYTGFVDPWLRMNDPDACEDDGVCVGACGTDDVDCPQIEPGLAGPVTGGCRAGGDGPAAPVLLALAALLVLRRRRRRR